MKTENMTQYDHPGRPRYEMKFPKGAEWTFVQLMRANGVDTAKRLANGKDNPNYGKGDNCTMLTLRKNLDFCIYAKTAKGEVSKRKGIDPKSIVVPIEGVTAEPDSDSGLGRRATLYRLRSVPAKDHSAELAAAPVVTPKARKTRKPKKSTTEDLNKVPMLSNEEYEALKAPVATPETTIAPAPAPVTPAAPEVSPAAVETAPVIAPAPVAEPVAAAPVEAPIANETPTAPEAVPAPVVTDAVPV